MNNLTDREFWSKYWHNYNFQKVGKKVFYSRYLKFIKNSKSMIEIGGFPGLNAIYFYKNICQDVTILDSYIDYEIVNKLEIENNIETGTINCIEADFFQYKSHKKWDVVMSVGFIEHFKDTHDVINRHLNLLAENGKLLIILPNFKGLNGLIQFFFDKKNYYSHNIKSMDIVMLKDILKSSPVNQYKVFYYPKPILWIEPKPDQNKMLPFVIKILSYALKILPIPSKLLSSYIIVTAEK